MSGKGVKGSHGSHRTCEICGAMERNLTSVSTLFSRFPLDEIRCTAWLRAAGNEELVHLPMEKLHHLRYICGSHFQRKDFNKKGNRLKKRAISNLSANPLSDDELIGFPQRMWRSRNVSVPEEPCEGSSSKQAEMTRNVSVPEEPCAGPSTNQAEMTRNGAVAVTEKEVCPRLHEQNIIQLTITMLYAHCDIEWFTCIEHKKQIFKMLFTRLALLFLRRKCQIINETIASQEERLANANKIAQQQGTTK